MVVAAQESNTEEFQIGERVWYVCQVVNAKEKTEHYYPAYILGIHPKSMMLKVYKRPNYVDIHRVHQDHYARIKKQERVNFDYI